MEGFGNVNADFYETFTGIECKDVNVVPMGVANADKSLMRLHPALSICILHI